MEVKVLVMYSSNWTEQDCFSALTNYTRHKSHINLGSKSGHMSSWLPGVNVQYDYEPRHLTEHYHAIAERQIGEENPAMIFSN